MKRDNLFLKTKLSLCFLMLIFCHSSLVAQEIDFLPVGTFGLVYDLQSNAYDKVMVDGRNTESLFENRRDHYKLEEADISGSIKMSSLTQVMTLQVGVLENLNLGLNLPMVSNSRSSSITVHNTGVAENNVFADTYGNASSEGLGDVSFYGIWRAIYHDELDFRVGLELNGSNAPYHYQRQDAVALGSGAQEATTYLRWKVYPNANDMITDIKVQMTFTYDDQVVAATGEELTLKRGRSAYMHLNLSYNDQAWNYGGGLQMHSQAETLIDEQQQGDGYLAYHLNMFVNYGNLYQLEEGKVGMPWMVQVALNSAIIANNAPKTTTLGLKAYLYF